MSERHENSKDRDKNKLGVKHAFTSRLRRASPAMSEESLANPSRRSSPLPKTAAAGPSSAPKAANVQPPDASTAQPGRDAFTIFLGSGVFGPLQPAINDLVEFFEVYKDSVAAGNDYAALQEDLRSLRDALNASFPGGNPIVEALCRSVDDELNKISERKRGGTGRRFMQASKDLGKVEACYRRIRGEVHKATIRIVGDQEKRLDSHGKRLMQHKKALGEQKKRLDSHGKMLRQHKNVLGEHTKRLDEQAKSAEEREKVLGEHTSKLEEQARLAEDKATEDQLKELKPSLSADYKSSEAANLRRECTPNTRKDVLSHLDEWRRDPNQGNIFWMNGMAGTGKTTIANTLCATLKAEQKLGASFFCTRTLPECRSVKFILPTIAYQLARFSSPFRDTLSQVLKSDPDLRSRDLPTQLEKLILAPLRNATESLSSDVVIVVDALDECEERAGVEEILGVFMTQASTLPIKVFVSSRPEEEIRGQIGATTSRVVLHELDKKTVQDDIGLYLREELKGILVSDDQLAKLVERAGVLFIYASTVARFINAKRSPSGQQERLKIVLSTSSASPSRKDEVIDALYSAVLESAFSKPGLEDFERDRMRELLQTVVCAQEPLTADALAGLLQLADGDLVLDSLEPLWSVIHVSGTGGTSLVNTLHASFPDYMLDQKRSKNHSCNATVHHGQLAELCLARIKNNERQFNICELESSYVPDEQVSGLQDRINSAVPLDLSYACQYWAAHLELGGWSTDRVKLLEHFLWKQLLIWMEVLNLNKRMNTGAVSLEKARKWCTNGGDSGTIGELIHDAWRFVTTFASNPVSRSTPHIYISMLAFWPNSKLITDCYTKRARRLVEVTGSGLTRRQLALLGVFAVGSRVWSVAFSPDGTRIICGGEDRAISVWDVQSGKLVLGPLKGHTERVNSVAFSPDGQRIASGSKDNTIRLWDARRGKELRTLEGHTRWVNSVAFSPNSARIVSGSLDKTIRVWDAQSGEMVLGPLEGHTSWVFSVAFSPDGTRIVSGFADTTILVWDSQSGQVALGPLRGHTAPVKSVAFSPDGDQIVSGSDDRTIRVWDAQSGKPILEPLQGHTGPVNAVTFSPNGTHIASGSYDKSIRVWDARGGKVVLGPLEGHASDVTSVTFSPDGMRIVSGSYDKTIRVWDVQSRAVASGPFEGHTESVQSVAFAPDGTRIFSGSGDNTVRVWNAQTGKMVLGTLKGHTEWVTAVAFSPDGRLIVSGSFDRTIRVRDAQNGEMVPGSPMNHTSSVDSIAFSPDGTRIVSGSDRSIHVWDVESAKMLLGPLEGHMDWVRSVVFSPDGMQIASGGDDQTLLVWDAQDGKKVLSPLQGHTSYVNSVAFSPNGRSIVSGSYDRTVRVWDVENGNMVLGPLEGHTDSVQTVAFSPNGTYIASGSQDKTIRVWAAQTGELVLGPLNGHTQPIQSVSFSPDSTHIVSGSDDKVIRVWHLPSPLLSADCSSPGSPSPSRAVADSPISQPNLPRPTPHNMPLLRVPDEEGWVLDEHQDLWLWVPLDLRASLILPHNYNTLLISTQGAVHLNLDGAAIGESWADCYTPA